MDHTRHLTSPGEDSLLGAEWSACVERILRSHLGSVGKIL